MPIVKRKPLTPGQRFFVELKRTHLTKKKPEGSLLQSKHRKKGRNCYGRITSRRRGGGHKRRYRIIDFKRDKYDIPAKVQAIEYDPNRSADIALLAYADGEKRYILAPTGVQVGDVLISTLSPVEDYKPGYSLQLRHIPLASFIHAIEGNPDEGAKYARGAGVGAQLMAIEGNKATLKMPSGEIRYLNSRCRATMGVVGNQEHNQQKLGKAGRRRWMGRRPRVRGVAMNPVDHPMGGGEGRTSGGGQPQSPWGILSKGYPTRRKSKTTNKMIIVRRNGRKVKNKKG